MLLCIGEAAILLRVSLTLAPLATDSHPSPPNRRPLRGSPHAFNST